MKLLTKNSDYAIRALVVLAKNKDNFLSARAISAEQNIPYQFLRRIFQELIKNKLIVSREGGSGGLKINKSPGSINIIDIITIFQGNLQLTECMFREQLCNHKEKCILRREIKRVEHIIHREFQGITLERLLKKQKREV